MDAGTLSSRGRKERNIVCSTYSPVSYTHPLYDKNGNYNYDYDIQNNTDKDLGFNIFEERQNTSNESVANPQPE